ncbi:MAG TPA: alpha-D-ribose 1-methylphosphonate 5-triphosphate diphosphatase [Candidatus Elarobacter sp.]|nr:alpha-D-ribose 1-methylphosphonate 5-triphosphate diphosphatase [Candidatus Elarobacter sp.]
MIDVPSATREAVYTNYRLQLPHREVLGTLVVRDGRIAAIDAGITAHGIDGEGRYLMPGLVELHTDNLERMLSPRPGIRWPADAAALYHDAVVVSAGITTVFDAIAIGDIADGAVAGGSPRVTHHRAMVDAIVRHRAARRFAADHEIHLRCELVYEDLVPTVQGYVDRGEIAMLSLMDHTPGQRQFVDLRKFEQYYVGKHGVKPDELAAFVERRKRDHRTTSPRNRAALVRLARERGLPLASHDDATAEHVDEALRDGVRIAEFPTTELAAAAAHGAGLAVVVGAPNIVQGRSHSGNVSALDLVRAGYADVYSSDYVPHSLLHAVFLTARETGMPLHEAMRAATVTPARAAGLEDRGTLEVGMRADLVMVASDDGMPRVAGVVVGGTRVG